MTYLGSGKKWKRHFKKYGKEHIKTLDVWGFDDQELCTEFALRFSRDNDIVNSTEWANLIEENGRDGGNISKTTRNKIANTLTDFYQSDDGIAKRKRLSDNMKKRVVSEETREKIRQSRSKIKLKPRSEESKMRSRMAYLKSVQKAQAC